MTSPEAQALHDLLVVRPPQLSDAAAMTAISIDRRGDMSPGNPGFLAQRIAWYQEHGLDKYRKLIVDAQMNPEQQFARVATIGDTVVGYAAAEAPDGDTYTYWRGMLVARGYDGQGIGRALESERWSWARQIGRAVRALIVVGNDRSMDFFQLQGFEQVDIQEPTTEQPLRLNVMELGLVALNGFKE